MIEQMWTGMTLRADHAYVYRHHNINKSRAGRSWGRGNVLHYTPTADITYHLFFQAFNTNDVLLRFKFHILLLTDYNTYGDNGKVPLFHKHFNMFENLDSKNIVIKKVNLYNGKTIAYLNLGVQY